MKLVRIYWSHGRQLWAVSMIEPVSLRWYITAEGDSGWFVGHNNFHVRIVTLESAREDYGIKI